MSTMMPSHLTATTERDDKKRALKIQIDESDNESIAESKRTRSGKSRSDKKPKYSIGTRFVKVSVGKPWRYCTSEYD